MYWNDCYLSLQIHSFRAHFWDNFKLICRQIKRSAPTFSHSLTVVTPSLGHRLPLVCCSGYLGQGLTACLGNQLDLQTCWPQSTQGSGEAGCGGLHPCGLKPAWNAYEPLCLVCVKTLGKLCNYCNCLKCFCSQYPILGFLHLVCGAVPGIRIPWGYSWLVFTENEVVKLGNKHFVLICLWLMEWDFALKGFTLKELTEI